MSARFLHTLLVILFVSAMASAQGIIIPDECHRCPPQPPMPRPRPLPRVLKVKSTRITTKIESQVATTKVEQIFENETPYRLEGSYFFPIPESASVSDFAIFDGDKRMSGEVMERTKARQIYNEIVRRQIDPGLLEYVGKDLFQASVFPIEPRSTRKIEISYTQALKNENGVVSYKYDLGSGRRIIQQPIGEISASVEIVSPVDLKNIFSPTHKISVKRDGERRARLSLENSGEEAQKDFQLYYSLSEKEFGLAMLTHREPGKDGFFMLMISPKVNIEEKDRIAKDVMFVFDTSGSMSGEKIVQAKAALKFGVNSLGEHDRFNIIAFSGEERLMKSNLVEASPEARRNALSFIDRIEATGGTNINDALVAGFKQFQTQSSDRASMMVFVTDGKPTVGLIDIKQIVKNATDANRANVRLFSFGVGYDLNASLLDLLSASNHGMSDYIEPGEDIEVKVSNFFAKVNYPVLSDLKLDFDKAEVELMYPRTLPDLFKGSQLTILGRYKNPVNKTTITLTGNIGSRAEALYFNGQKFPEEESDNRFLPRLWATRRVGYLMEQIRLNGENSELKDEVVALGTRYGIVTPYTSFLITEDLRAMDRRPSGEKRTRSFQNAAPAASVAEGAQAVARSKVDQKMKDADIASADDEAFTGMKTVGNKTFTLKDGVWVDTEYKQNSTLPKVTLKFGSQEFFDLLTKKPALAEFFSLGQKLVLVFEGKVYQVE